jgi:cardiolipin synthase
MLLTDQAFYALIFFGIAAVSDALDGFIARYTKSRSKLGAYLDPLADKLLFLCTFLVLGYLKIIPLWLIVLSIYRDIVIVLGVAVLRYYKVAIEIKPLWISKINTFIQSIVVVMFLVIQAFNFQNTPIFAAAYVCAYINVLTLLLSGVGYIRQGLQRLEGYGFVYICAGVFICLFILMMNYMIADGAILMQLIYKFLCPSSYRVVTC